jgi:F0F1-type ATP synthase membrane subunit b/b'
MSIRTLLIAGFVTIAMLASLAEVQPTLLAVASSRDANVEANVGSASTGKSHATDENQKFAAERTPHKKKKTFMHKMRDKATEQLQKLLGSKPDENRNP